MGVIVFAATFALAGASGARAQSGGINAPAFGNAPPDYPPAPSDNSSSDQTLEIAPRVVPPAPPEPAAPPPNDQDNANAGTSAGAPDTASASGSADTTVTATHARPYLGMTVQAIYANDQPGRIVTGLEVVSVDPGGPAARAGLQGRTKMSSLGETGATAGALLPPLDIVVMPLLKRAGSLGRGGDLIVAIDDKRVTDNLDLQTALAPLKPGDTIYLTVVRTMPDRSMETLKLPLKLGDAANAIANAATGAQAPGAASAAAPASR